MQQAYRDRLFVLACLSACSGDATRAAPTAPTAPSAPPAPPAPTCVIEGDDVALGFTLSSDRPDPTASVAHPFAEIHHAAHVRIELTDEHARFVEARLETAMVRLHGMVEASELALYPAAASIFGDMIIPLATNKLQWRGRSRDQVALVPARHPGGPLKLEPEWRSCSFLKLRPEPPFDLGAQLGLHSIKTMKLRAGGYDLRVTPEAQQTTVALYLMGNEKLQVLEERGPQSVKVLYDAGDTAYVGWLDLRDGPGGSLGHGAGTGTRAPKTCSAEPLDCEEEELKLFSNANGKLVEIGVLKRAARYRISRLAGDYDEIELCDPDITLLEQVVISDSDRLSCFPKRPYPPNVDL
jgi:hypothetical protein